MTTQYCEVSNTLFFASSECTIEQALLAIKAYRKSIIVVDKIPASINEHHNHVRADGKAFSYLDDLSFRSRQVLKCLKYLGLYEVKFGRFYNEGGKKLGILV